MSNGISESVRGWIAIGLVALGGLAASFHSYYAGQSDALVMQAKLTSARDDITGLQETVIKLTSDVTRLKTLHEQRGTRRRR